MNFLILALGKFFSFISTRLNFGNGSTWPGHIALKINKNFLKQALEKKDIKIIFVVGTNGKTTTSKILQTILNENKIKTIINSSGANLLNGIASSLILNSDLNGKLNANVIILEIDENVLPLIANFIEPDFLIALNLFRDQLDRYGEIDTIAKKWQATLSKFKKTILILNSDDPQMAFLGENKKLKSYYFGLEEKDLELKQHQHAADSLLCPRCNTRLNFDSFYFSHLGKWECKKCALKRPIPNLSKFNTLPLSGTYAKYNIFAAVLTCKLLNLTNENIENALKTFTPAFGRQEKLKFKNKNIQLFLSKNPISLNESLDTVKKLNGKTIIFGLNDRIPDGLDVSWIWDVEIEKLVEKDMNIYTYGDRAYDMSLRLKYAEKFNRVIENLELDLDKIINNLDDKEILYILPNYSAMLDVRKILTGKKIL